MKAFLKAFFITSILIYKSTAFAGWSQPVLIDTVAASPMYPRIAARNDSIYVLYSNVRNDFGANKFARSVDSGLTWSDYYTLPNGSVPEYTDLKVGNDTLVIFYAYDQFPYTHHFTFSSDYGENREPPRNIICPFLLYGGSFDYSHSNATICGAQLGNGGDYSIITQSSYDFGLTWPDTETVFTYGHAAAITEFYFYYDRPFIICAGYLSDFGHSRMQIMRKIGANWIINNVYNNGGDDPRENICASSNGQMAMAFQDLNLSVYDSSRAFVLTSADSGMTWSDLIEISVERMNMNPRAAISNDTVLVLFEAWPDTGDVNRILYLKKSFDLGATWQPLENISENAVDGDIDFNNSVIHIVYKKLIEGQHFLYYQRWDQLPDAIEENNETIPDDFILYAYPNPFNSATAISCAGADKAEIGIYDIAGRQITTLLPSGGRAVWYANGLASGVYFAKAMGYKSRMIKLVLIK